LTQSKKRTELTQPASVRADPANEIEITPPHEQVHIAPAVNAGRPPISVRVAPGAHGATGTGTHGIGVNTPSAAAVADATVGLLNVVHIPNGGMFTMGAISVMAAAGFPSMNTRLVGSTFSVDGAMPKLHMMVAVAVAAGCPMVFP